MIGSEILARSQTRLDRRCVSVLERDDLSADTSLRRVSDDEAGDEDGDDDWDCWAGLPRDGAARLG